MNESSHEANNDNGKINPLGLLLMERRSDLLRLGRQKTKIMSSSSAIF
jgi:hypothetical protein